MFRDIPGWNGDQTPADRTDAAIRRHLRKLRSQAGLTQEQVARSMNMERSVYSKYETGKLRLSQDFLSRFARLFQTDSDSLRREALAESLENQTPERQSEQLRQQLDISFSTEKPDFLPRGARFTGRTWLVQEVETWLDDPDGSQLMVLYGDPGIGKTSFSARLVHSSTRIPGCLFCDAQDPRFRDPRILIRTLAWLLACSLPDYRLSLVSVLADRRHPENLSAQELRELLIETPLRDQLLFDDNMEVLCMLVDGIDACSLEETGDMAQLLAETVRKLPKWVRILVTAREMDRVKAALADFPCLELRGTEERNQADVKEYLTALLKKQSSGIPDWDAVLENLLQRSGGIFLYAQAMAESILSGRMSIRSLDSLPEGIPPVFHRWFGDLFPDEAEYRTLWGPGLALILASPEPIPREELRRTLAWTQAQEQSFFRRMNLLLRADTDVFRKETAEIADPFLRLWLTGAARDRDIYEVSLTDALNRMADAFFARMKRDRESLSEYEALHLQEYLEKTGRTEQLTEARISWTLAVRLHAVGNLASENEDQTDNTISDLCYDLCREICKRLIAQSDDPDHRHFLALVSFQLGQNRYFRNDPDGAIAEFRAALKQEQILLKQDPDNVASRSHILWCCWETALALNKKEKRSAALRYCNQGLKAGEQQIRKSGTLEDKRVLCELYSLKGDLLNAKHRRKGALTEYEKSFSLTELIREEDPEFHRDIGYALTLMNAAKLAEEQNDLQRAIELNRKAAAEAEQFCKDNPPDWFALESLHQIYEDMFQLFNHQGKSDEEEACFCICRMAEVAEQMMTLPEDEKTDRFGSCFRMMLSGFLAGDQEYRRGNLDRARELCEEVIQSMPELRKTGDCFMWNLAEGTAYKTLGVILADREDQEGRKEAMQKLLRGKELLERADTQFSKNDKSSSIQNDLLCDLLDLYTHICHLLQEERSPLLDKDNPGPEPELHLDVMNRMLPLLERQMTDHPEDDAFRIQTATVLYQLKPFLMVNHEDNRLQANADRILALMERDVSAPNDQDRRTMLQGYAFQMKAEVQVRRGNREEAIHLFRQAEKMYIQNYERTGTADGDAWCTVYRGLGDLLRELHRYDEAIESYRDCIRMAEEYYSPEFLFLNISRFEKFICMSWIWISVCQRASGDPKGALESCKTLQERIRDNVQTACPSFDDRKDDVEYQKWDVRQRFLVTSLLTGETYNLLMESGDPEGAALFDLETAVFSDWGS